MIISIEKKIEMNNSKIHSIKDSIAGLTKQMQSRVEMLDSCRNQNDITSCSYYSVKIAEDAIEVGRLLERLGGREELLHCQMTLLKDNQEKGAMANEK